MKKLILFLVFILFQTSSSFGQEEEKIKSILQKSKDYYSKVNNGRYKYINKFKTIYNVKDTSINTCICIFQKDKKSKLGVKLNIQQLTSKLARIYDGSIAYFIRLKDSTYFKDAKLNKSYNRTLKSFYDKTPLVFAHQFDFFAHINNLDQLNNVTKKDLKKNNLPTNLMKVNLSEKEEHYVISIPFQKQVYIRKDNYQVEIIKEWIFTNEGTQYEEFQIKEQSFNKTTYENDSLYSENALLRKYKLRDKSQDNKAKITTEVGGNSPDWQLPVFGGDSIRLSDLKGKVVFLDFWYQKCRPCVEAIPNVEALYQKYKNRDDVMILGINPFDKNKEDLEIFIKKRNMTYPILWQASEVNTLYRISGHPTVILIDKNGEILYKESGFFKSHFRKIVKLIDNNL